MKRLRLGLWVCICLCATSTLMGQNKVKTTAEKVMLFIDGAQVTRTKQVDIPAGNSTLTFTGLSPYMDAQSMQVSAKGKFTVVAVNRQFNYIDSLSVSEKQQSLQKELKKIEKQQKEQSAELGLINAEYEMLKTNCSVSNKSTTASLATIKEVNQYYSGQMKALKTKELAINEQIAELAIKQKQLNSEIAQLSGKSLNSMSEIVVNVNAPAACKGTFTLNYYVKNAGWFPSYDVRSGSLAEPISIVYKANIFQNTKEEWKNVDLSLSSSNPSTGSVAPKLSTYWLDYGLAAPRYDVNLNGNMVSGVVFGEDRTPLPGVNIIIPGTTIGTISDVNGKYSITIPNGQTKLQFSYIGCVTQTRDIRGSVMNITLLNDNQMLDEVVVVGYGTQTKSVMTGTSTGIKKAPQKLALYDEEASMALDVKQSQGQMGYEFEIKLPYTIPSDNKPVVAEIGKYELPASYVYQSTPKIDKDAFLMAQVTDWEKLNLLEGEANVYFENTFIGKSIVNVTQQNDTLSFSLGRDKRIMIQRTKENEYTSRKFIGSNQTQSIAWKLSIRNTRTEPVTLTLYDQLPVSRNSNITVAAEEISGGTLDEEKGIITWQITLQPGEQRELPLRYKVKYPKGRNLIIE
ncbi:mucoidy inhibitor MuiA family protein [Bacteroides sp. UBA939]|uniref:mucoidy inhibitor MuiA family protein n=1 Tax=Bacteroides sp. UBA939 TaxID=1946092 RepID=UPI0025BC5C0E|nr:mucoidy inhibitor MuiA family protein [Bacteroides sp. UBA939]